jgi:hypothetical protein
MDPKGLNAFYTFRIRTLKRGFPAACQQVPGSEQAITPPLRYGGIAGKIGRRLKVEPGG